MKSLLLAYVLWLFGGFFGLHKFYLGRPILGLLYFFSGAFFGIGWIIDLFTLPRQVRLENLLLQNRTESVGSTLRRELDSVKHNLRNVLDDGGGAPPPLPQVRVTDDDLMLGLLRAAHKHSGRLSVTQGVMETGLSFAEAERVLNKMTESNYVYVDNDVETGVLVYVFKEVF